MSLEEATISNMWEIAAIVEVLERKGLRTKQDLYDVITEFRRKNSLARIPETVFPSGIPDHRNREQDCRRHPGTTQYARADFAPDIFTGSASIEWLIAALRRSAAQSCCEQESHDF